MAGARLPECALKQSMGPRPVHAKLQTLRRLALHALCRKPTRLQWQRQHALYRAASLDRKLSRPQFEPCSDGSGRARDTAYTN